MSTPKFIAFVIATLLGFAIMTGSIVVGITKNHEIDAKQYSQCVQTGASPSECRLSIYGSRR